MLDWLVMTTAVSSCSRDIVRAERIYNILTTAWKIEKSRGFHTSEEMSLIAASRFLKLEDRMTIRLAVHDKLMRFIKERERFVCPECDAPTKIAYDGKEPAGYLFKITTCSKDESHFRTEETIRSPSVKPGVIPDENGEFDMLSERFPSNDIY